MNQGRILPIILKHHLVISWRTEQNARTVEIALKKTNIFHKERLTKDDGEVFRQNKSNYWEFQRLFIFPNFQIMFTQEHFVYSSKNVKREDSQAVILVNTVGFGSSENSASEESTSSALSIK
jgi:hypothetical protein